MTQSGLLWSLLTTLVNITPKYVMLPYGCLWHDCPPPESGWSPPSGLEFTVKEGVISLSQPSEITSLLCVSVFCSPTSSLFHISVTLIYIHYLSVASIPNGWRSEQLASLLFHIPETSCLHRKKSSDGVTVLMNLSSQNLCYNLYSHTHAVVWRNNIHWKKYWMNWSCEVIWITMLVALWPHFTASVMDSGIDSHWLSLKTTTEH